MSEQTRVLTTGEQRVRIDFNVATSHEVAEIKRLAAQLIDLVENYKGLDPRLGALAQTAFEEGAMWAVKLVTVPPASN